MYKKEQFLSWCESNFHPFSSVDVFKWGYDNYYTRAVRTIRNFAADPRIPIRRIPDDEAILRGLVEKRKARLAFFEIQK